MATMNKLGQYLLVKALTSHNVQMKDWLLYCHLVRFRREAHATALVLGWVDRFYDLESMKKFFYEEIFGDRNYFGRRPKQELEKMFRAWKPFVSKYGLTNASYFVKVLEEGARVSREIRHYKNAYDTFYDYRLRCVSFTFLTIANAETHVDSTLDVENIARLRMNKALATWLPKQVAKQLNKKILEKGTSWNRPSVHFVIGCGKLTIAIENLK